MRSPNKQFYKLGLIGHPVAHSLSPLMHRAAIAFCGLAGSYELIDLVPENLLSGLAEIKRAQYAGFNVTVPHKQALIDSVDELTWQAKMVQAVNTVRIDESGRLIGHNTDVGGFIRALTPLLPALDDNSVACLVGAGGAARAALWGLASLGFKKVVVVARNLGAARVMRDQFLHGFCQPGFEPLSAAVAGNQFADAGSVLTLAPQVELVGVDCLDEQLTPMQIVVNSTSIGVTDLQIPGWYLDLINILASRSAKATAANLTAAGSFRRPFFYDMVYTRSGAPTQLQVVAAQHQLPSSDGLQMLIEQAAQAFYFWTSRQVPAEIMRSGLQAGQSNGC